MTTTTTELAENELLVAMAGAALMLRHVQTLAAKSSLPLGLGLLGQIMGLEVSFDQALQMKLPSLDDEDRREIGLLALEEVLP